MSHFIVVPLKQFLFFKNLSTSQKTSDKPSLVLVRTGGPCCVPRPLGHMSLFRLISFLKHLFPVAQMALRMPKRSTSGGLRTPGHIWHPVGWWRRLNRMGELRPGIKVNREGRGSALRPTPQCHSGEMEVRVASPSQSRGAEHPARSDSSLCPAGAAAGTTLSALTHHAGATRAGHGGEVGAGEGRGRGRA